MVSALASSLDRSAASTVTPPPEAEPEGTFLSVARRGVAIDRAPRRRRGHGTLNIVWRWKEFRVRVDFPKTRV